MSKRRMPLEENWFDKKVNDILYGFMQASATFNPDEKDEMKKLYYPKKQFQKEKKIIMTLIGCTDMRTVKGKLKIIMDKGYLAEDDNNYYFPYNYDNHYVLMEKDLLSYICTTMNEFALKTYVYLADKARMKDNYHFTIKELKIAFGYSESTREIEKVITNCLDLFQKIEMIKYHVEHVTLENANGEYKVPNLVLDSVETQLPKERVDNIQIITQVSAASDKFIF